MVPSIRLVAAWQFLSSLSVCFGSAPSPTPEAAAVDVLLPKSGVYAYDQGVRIEWITTSHLDDCAEVDLLLYVHGAAVS